MTREAPVLIVPGLRDHVAEHWQKLLHVIAPRLLVAQSEADKDVCCAAYVGSGP